jgi:membrane protease YdiL (CAAX protease family)
MILALGYLLAITVAELATVGLQPIWGIVGHVFVFIAILVHSSLSPRKLILALALVPLVRIISLSMPLANIPQIWWYPIIYVPLLLAAIVAARILDYGREDIGVTIKLLPVQLLVMLTGIGFGLVEYFILAPEPMIAELSWQTALLPAFILIFTTGFVEELIFRGILQRAAVESFGGWGIVYISFLFAILHIGFLSWVDVVFVFAIAMFFGWVVKKTGSLLGVTLSHGLTNIILFLVAPFLF